MKTEAVVCDSPSCRRLADDACVLCERDLCASHAQIKLRCVVDVFKAEQNVAEDTLCHDAATGWKVPGRTNAALCESCAVFMRGQNILEATEGVYPKKLITDFFASVVEHARALKASKALAKDNNK